MGLNVLYPHSTSTGRGPLTVDIVAVHGLRGDARRTWTESKSKRLWLQDFLPQDIDVPRVMSFDYNAAAAFGNTTAEIYDHANSLLGSLKAHRRDEAEAARPIVFIAHSLGGIIVKKALVIAHSKKTDYDKILNNTKGIFFFATPHRGSDFASYGKVLATIATRLLNRPAPKLLAALESNSKDLLKLTTEFTNLSHKFQISTFYELKPMGVFRSLIVEKKSAILEIESEASQGVDANHIGICRFSSRDDTYLRFISWFNEMVPKGTISQGNREAPGSLRCDKSYNEFYEVPYNVSSIFTGRDDISQKLVSKCPPTEPAVTQKMHNIFVLHGLGGIGKTQICLNFAQSNQENFWGIFLADVSSMSKAEQSFSKLAYSCRVGDNTEAFKRWLANRTERWLLILDNADEMSLPISKYFPPGAGGTIIITTRNRELGIVSTTESALIDEMGPNEATSLLLKAANDDDPSSRDRAQPVVQALGYHPLAIVHAGAAIRQQLYTYEEYREMFMYHRKDMLKYQSHQATDYEYTVYATWEISVNAIEKIAEGGEGVLRATSVDAANALELLNVFGFFYRDGISEEILQEAWDRIPFFVNDAWWMSNMIQMFREDRSPEWTPLPFRRAIDLLSSYSLVYITNRRIALHPLVHCWIRDRLDEASNLDEGSNLHWWTTALTMLAMATKSENKGNAQRRRLLGPHIEACLKLRDIGDFLSEDDAAKNRLEVIERLLSYAGRDVFRENLLLLGQRSVSYGAKMLDEDDPLLWKILDATACLASNLGKWQIAADLLEAKVASFLDNRTLDSEYSIESLRAINRFIPTYLHLERTQEALKLTEKVLQICKKSQGEDHYITSYIEERLAHVYSALGWEDDSIDLLETAYSKMRAALGANYPRCVRSQRRLARSYLQRDPQKAFDLYQQVLEWQKANLMEDDPDILHSQVRLAIAYRYLDRPQDGIPLVVDALEKGEKTAVQERRMNKWRSRLEGLRAEEAEQIAQRRAGSVETEEPPGQAGEEKPFNDKNGIRVGLKKMFRRDKHDK